MTTKVDLRKIIDTLIKNSPQIEEIYLFGSRGYNTGSINSDIDVLCFSKTFPVTRRLNDLLCSKFPWVDLFITIDKKSIMSCSNGTSISYRGQKGDKDIIDQLDAVLLWDSANKLNEKFTEWEQEITVEIGMIEKSILPSKGNSFSEKEIDFSLIESKLGIKPFFVGKDSIEISNTIVKLIDVYMTQTPENKICKKAECFNFNFVLKDEYDFQNYIMLALRPIFPDIERESPTIRIDGNSKIADFSLVNSSIIIEAKWINSTSKKAEVLKTLEGLNDFYSHNSNVKAIIFLIGYEENVEIDTHQLEYIYSSCNDGKTTLVKFYKNIYIKI